MNEAETILLPNVGMDSKIAAFKNILNKYPQADPPLKHTFSPGLYTRAIYMPAGMWCVSKIHLTEHQFFVCQGVVSVWSENDGQQLIQAPYFGITKPNTRRLLYCHSDVIWITVHPVSIMPKGSSDKDLMDAVNEIEKLIIKLE